MISKSIFCVSILLLLLPVAWSQSSGAPASSSPGEVTFGGYRIHQSIEAGYRVSDETGNGSMFNTLVNEHEGPRLFAIWSRSRQRRKVSATRI